MQDLLVKMAQKAVSNEDLMANYLQSYCQKHRKTWADVATQLNITEKQLAKLALCRQPTKQNFAQDIAQIAQYINIEESQLTPFLQPTSLFNTWKQTLRSKRPSLRKVRENSPMIKRRAIAFIIALIAILFVSAYLFNQPANNNATLHVSTGIAIVTQTSSFGNLTIATVQTGESLTLSTEDVIEMADDSTAELFLFEGSQVELAANTKLELTELTHNESDHQIYMTLFSGRIINRVTKLLGVDDTYEVRTPSSTASVRGTIFSVAVIDNNATEVNVAEGVVEVALGNDVAQVHAGEMVTAVIGQPLKIETSNNSQMLPTATPTLELTNEVEGNESNADEEPLGANETSEPEATDDAEEINEVEGTSEPAATDESMSTPITTTAIPATSSPANPTVTSDSPPANTTTSPTLPTDTAEPQLPTNTPLPDLPTNTPLPPPPTNTSEPPPPTAAPTLVTLCHNPGANQQTKQVPQSAVQGHLDHGDHLGTCN